ncbi:protein-s-isoprenylcysteine O-methyltransferase [Clavulina sp. PMI_390]|nr:protein-s-isoprenylcysteine O-methyltransferase [Clavulina sp. PMI_390]
MSSSSATTASNGATTSSAPNPPRGALETIPTDGSNPYRGQYIPNTPLGASTVSVILGIAFTLGTLLAMRGPAAFVSINGSANEGWRALGFFIAAWAGFHWGEYAVAAGWNRTRCSVDSFLLENGVEYHIAHAVAITEFVLTMLFAPRFKQISYVTYAGIALMFVAQYLRSSAMITAASNFSHQLVTRRERDHKLVTNGIYAYFRHPSYTGFFYWALGAQLVLQNPLSFVAFSFVLWRFFSSRIAVEERYLILFFGEDYRVYRKTVGTWIPFIH